LAEAAAIDGAGATRRFWRIVFLRLAPTSFFLLVVNIVYAFSTFSGSSTTRPRGPARATEILQWREFSGTLTCVIFDEAAWTLRIYVDRNLAEGF
jgi:sn-glycerol 3-phosphate transport system permease protein